MRDTFATETMAMANFIGNLPYFQNLSDWSEFAEQLDVYIIVNEIVDDQRKTLLLTCLADGVNKTLLDICYPQLPKEKTYEELMGLMAKQFVVQTSVHRERVAFYRAKQNKYWETIAQWFLRLKELSLNCKFEGRNVDGILLDRFISGLKSNYILTLLYAENETLTYLSSFISEQSKLQRTMKVLALQIRTVITQQTRNKKVQQNNGYFKRMFRKQIWHKLL